MEQYLEIIIAQFVNTSDKIHDLLRGATSTKAHIIHQEHN